MLSLLQQSNPQLSDEELELFQNGLEAHLLFTMDKLLEFMTLDELNDTVSAAITDIEAQMATEEKPDLHLVH